MVKRRVDTENQIAKYIQDQTKHSKVFSKPISKIAEEIGSSTSTVWRIMQKLQDKRIIKVIKSKSATEPDTIYYLGGEDNVSPIVEQINKYINSITIMVSELSEHLVDKQKLIDELTYQLELSKSREKQILGLIHKED